VVATYCESKSLRESDAVKESIMTTFRDDFAKYAPRINISRLQKVFNSLPLLVGSKIKYVNIDRHEKSRDLEATLYLLELARIFYRVYHSSGNGIPLRAQINQKFAKPVFLDVGLMCRACGLNLSDFNNVDEIITINSGALAEQVVGQHLLYRDDYFMEPSLFYWTREKAQSSAEVDYLISKGQNVIPIEVKAGKTGSLKSMQMFLHEKKQNIAMRFNSDLPSLVQTQTTLPGTQRRFSFMSLPFYLLDQSMRLLEETISENYQ